MIDFLKGNIVSKSPTEMKMEVNGIGYNLFISLNSFYKFENHIGEILVYTYLQVREDAFHLFGFADESERMMFKNLISVSGIGPKIAIAILSQMSVSEIRKIIIQENVVALKSISGIGKKTAERIIVELKDKFSKNVFEGENKISISNKLFEDAMLGLQSLGFSKQESESLVRTVSNSRDNLTVEEIVKFALKKNVVEK